MAETNQTARPFYTCTEVNELCPVEATTLGYYPIKGLSIFFAVCFGLAGVITVVLGTWKKTWSYMTFVAAGCFLELAGYASRIPLADNPWNSSAFETQICAIILSPTLICISIYLTLKHICLSLSPELSRVRPNLYPFIFLPLDVSCLLIQAIGGALAASAGHEKPNLLEHGNRAIIAGICLQVAVLAFFGTTSLDYYFRVRKWIATPDADPDAVATWNDKKFRMFVFAVTGAYSVILIRCIYRIAEMVGGWGNHIMQDEPSFIVLESFMLLIACVLLSCFPPGFLFPQMAARMASSSKGRFRRKKKNGEKSSVSAAGLESGREAETTDS